MFNIFKKQTKVNELIAFVDGEAIALDAVKDEVFSKKMLGDGMAIVPTSGTVVSPVTGKLTMVFPTKHAFGLELDNGMEVLIHIGLDTVNLEGVGFEALKNQGTNVKQGEAIIKFDLESLKSQGYDCTTMMIITNANEHPMEFVTGNTVIAGKEVICKID